MWWLHFRAMDDTSWKRDSYRRRPSQFTADWSNTVALLAKEVDYIGGGDVTIELEVLPAQLKMDGSGLKAHQSPASPAVVVSFETPKHGLLVYRADALDQPNYRRTAGWKQNVRAVALTLEALRAVNRYGASESGEQYAGYKALPPGAPTAMDGSPLTHEQAMKILVENAPFNGAEGLTPAALVKVMKAHSHPDRNDGDRTIWDRIEGAIRKVENG